ncbi:hypothetical protein THIOSC13_70056 [uncultured Thiomicrorhabdus sp.]
MNVQIDPFYPVGENIDLESLSNRWGKSIEETVFITTALSIDVFSPFAYLVDVEIKDCQELLFTVDYDPAKSHCGFEWPRLIPLGVKGDVVEFTGMNRLNREFIQEGKGLAFPKHVEGSKTGLVLSSLSEQMPCLLYVEGLKIKEFEQQNNIFNHGLDLIENTDQKSNENNLQCYQDQESEHYAAELDIAIKAHKAVVVDGWRAKTNYGGFTGHLKAWLEENYPDASGAFIDRITTVANPKSDYQKRK